MAGGWEKNRIVISVCPIPVIMWELVKIGQDMVGKEGWISICEMQSQRESHCPRCLIVMRSFGIFD